jgi:hypothetical protein
MLTITSDVITSPHRGGTEGVRATRYVGRTQEMEFYARQALIALQNDACQ